MVVPIFIVHSGGVWSFCVDVYAYHPPHIQV